MRPGRRVLRKGCNGRDVAALQRKLKIKDDGWFGPATAKAVRQWKRRHGAKKPNAVVRRRMWRKLGVKRKIKPIRIKGTPEQIINRLVWEAQGFGFSNYNPERVRQSNNAHGPTVSGNRSDHQGPGREAWAADLSNGSQPTPEMDRYAALIAKWLDCPAGWWKGEGAVSWTVYKDGRAYRMQLIYRSWVGGNHFNHIHIGIRRW